MAYSKKKLKRLAEEKKAQKDLEKEQRKSQEDISLKKAKEDQIVQKVKDNAEKNKVSAPKKKSNQRYVALRNVDKMKLNGWKEVSILKNKHDRVLGVKTNTSDLTLMEK